MCLVALEALDREDDHVDHALDQRPRLLAILCVEAALKSSNSINRIHL